LTPRHRRWANVASAIAMGIAKGDNLEQFRDRCQDTPRGFQGVASQYSVQYRDKGTPKTRRDKRIKTVAEFLDGHGKNIPIDIEDESIREDGFYLAVVQVVNQQAMFRMFLYDAQKSLTTISREERFGKRDEQDEQAEVETEVPTARPESSARGSTDQ